MLPKRQGNYKYKRELPKYEGGGLMKDKMLPAIADRQSIIPGAEDLANLISPMPDLKKSADLGMQLEMPQHIQDMQRRTLLSRGEKVNNFLGDHAGNVASLMAFGANQRSIRNMPIRQKYQTVRPAMEDVTDRSGQAVNEAKRQARMARLLGAQAGGNAANMDNISAVSAAQASSQIGEIRTNENLRQDQIRSRNIDRGNQANMMNTSIYNQMEGDAISNRYLQQQNTINNRNALVQSILGNEFQRKNREMQEDALRLTLALEGGRGTYIPLQGMKFNDESLNEGIQGYGKRRLGGPINYKTTY